MNNLQSELTKKQQIVDNLYKEFGITDEVLELQVEINTIRNKENIHDPNEMIYEEWVQ